MMDSNLLQKYIIEHSLECPAYLNQLERDTWLKTLSPSMISGVYQGRLLSFISKLIRPKCILEIGTFTGYSTLCLAEGLANDGIIHTIEVKDELSYISNKYFAISPYNDRIKSYLGKAELVIPELSIQPELIFIDAGKKNYSAHYDLAIEKLAKHGTILIDNVLWHGKVIDESMSTDTLVIHEFNQKLKHDDRVEQIILPIRDGLTLIRKK